MTATQISERYRDGYRAGKFINWLGETLAAVGALLGLLIYAASVAAADALTKFPEAQAWVRQISHLGFRDQQHILMSIGIVSGIAVFALLGLAGTFISAAGQIIKALLDTAVNTSPFLSMEEKGDVIGATWWKDLLRAVRGD